MVREIVSASPRLEACRAGLIGAGNTSQEIAALLQRSIKTIEAHRANIRIKLRLDDGADLNRFAADWLRGQGGKFE